jgi:hypothetical protein
MRRAAALFLALLTLAVLSAAPTLAAPAQVAAPADADPCLADGGCRMVGQVPVVTGKGKVGTYPVNRPAPWIIQNNLMIFGGEIIVFRLDPADRFHRVSFVASGDEARSRTLQPGELRATLQAGTEGTTLTMESAHAEWLNYVAVMATPDGKGQKTSVCTLIPGKFVIEHWPHGIIYLGLANFDAAPEGQAVCR